MQRQLVILYGVPWTLSSVRSSLKTIIIERNSRRICSIYQFQQNHSTVFLQVSLQLLLVTRLSAIHGARYNQHRANRWFQVCSQHGARLCFNRRFSTEIAGQLNFRCFVGRWIACGQRLVTYFGSTSIPQTY